MRLRLGGRAWLLRIVKRLPPDRDGEADDETGELRVLDGLRERTTLRVLLHEMLHAADWSKSETWVDQTSRTMAHVLTRMGWRRQA